MRKADNIYNFFTYISAFIGFSILVSIIIFVFSKGISYLNFRMLTSNYWSENYLVEVSQEYRDKTGYDMVEVDGFYSEKWGIALKDNISSKNEKQIQITYIAEDSPFSNVLNATAGETYNQPVNIEIGSSIEKIDYQKNDDSYALTGKILKQSAEEVIESLNDAKVINSIYFKTQGEGIRGSLLSTLYLILISLGVSLPIGISSAVYLREYAKQNKFNSLIRQGIDTLTGIPSIIYGLMGMTVLFPITQAFGATTTSVLLGGLTMSIILLPTIIKSTEEALLVVPKSLRDASLSLGATQSQTVFKVILPCCINGILTGVILGIGRVIGESAALIYTMGTFINDKPGLLTQGTSLSVMIWSFMSGEDPNFELASAISIIILVIVLSLNVVVKIIGKKLEKKFA